MAIDLRTICDSHGVRPKGVLHIGAHEGEELGEYRALGASRIVLIEANPAVYERLIAKVRGQSGVTCVQCAASDRDGTTILHVTSMDQSSSILPLKLHSQIYPNIVETGQITVNCRCLDSLMVQAGLDPAEFNILHLDIQGAELMALRGAEFTLDHIQLIRSEVNLVELYEGCPLVGELDAFLGEHGFERVATEFPHHPTWGDATYVRKRPPAPRKPVIAMSNLGRNGRFGNQVFQYAFLRTYAQEHGMEVQTPPWIGHSLFGHNERAISLPLRPILIDREGLIEDYPPRELAESGGNVDVSGYFQYHTSIYREHKDFFRSLFQPTPTIRARLEPALKELRSRGKTIVGLHIRMGDYHDPKLPYALVAPIEVYKQFLREIWKTHSDPVLYVASDEVEKVREALSEFDPLTAADIGASHPEADFYPDFFVLAHCDVLAISNSTFSVLAAMLNENGSTFVRPTFEGTMTPFDPWDTPVLLQPPADAIERAAQLKKDERLPVHFFTIVLNGEPFIRHHIERFNRLPFHWHWHIVEGVADLKHDTAWSLASGGKIPDRYHRGGLSVDGTGQYLDHLTTAYPNHVSIYRKAPGQFWDGKREMVSAPASRIGTECLLWEVDADELWTTQQIVDAREMFLVEPARTAAYYRCWFFVGPDLTTTSLIPEGDDPVDWLRTWRFRPGMQWVAHEPPILAEPVDNGQWRDAAQVAPFRQHETAERGLIFQHYAYASLKQVQFKMDYYGYAQLDQRWRALQEAIKPARIREFFPWFKYDALVDRPSAAIPPVPDRAITADDLRAASGNEPPAIPSQRIRHIAWLRTDAIGDNILAAGMLEPIRKAYPNAKISVVCQASVAGLYEACPLVDGTIVAFDRLRAYSDAAYREQVGQQIAALGADLCLHSVHSREMLYDYFVSATRARERVGFRGDSCNIPPAQKLANDVEFTRLIESDPRAKVELERNREFLAALGIDAPALAPKLWTTPEDAARAEELMRQHGLEPGRTIALFASAKAEIKDYDRFGEALESICAEQGLRVVSLGNEQSAALNAKCLAALGEGVGVDLSGQTNIRESAEIVRRCLLAVGVDTSLAHVACAVGTPNVIVIGGGHFGRFLPYAPLTTLVCLPIACYGCNWNCKFRVPFCVRSIEAGVVECGVRAALKESSQRPRVVVQDRSLWKGQQSIPGESLPQWAWFHGFLDRSAIDIISVHARDGKFVSTALDVPERHRSSSVPQSVPDLQKQRREAANRFIPTPRENLPQAFAALLAPLIGKDNIRELPAIGDEIVILDELLSGLARGDGDEFALQYRSLMMLYLRPDEVPPWGEANVPSWAREAFESWSRNRA